MGEAKPDGLPLAHGNGGIGDVCRICLEGERGVRNLVHPVFRKGVEVGGTLVAHHHQVAHLNDVPGSSDGDDSIGNVRVPRCVVNQWLRVNAPIHQLKRAAGRRRRHHPPRLIASAVVVMNLGGRHVLDGERAVGIGARVASDARYDDGVALLDMMVACQRKPSLIPLPQG